MRFLPLLSGLLVFAPPLPAHILGVTPLAPQRIAPAPSASGMRRPTPLPVVVSRRVTQWDNIDRAKVVLTFGASPSIEVDASLWDDWQRIDLPGWSAAFKTRFASPVRFMFSAFRTNTVGSLLDASAWSAFTASLRGVMPGRNARILVEADSSQDRQMVRLFGGRTRVHECEFVTADADASTRRQLVIAAEEGGVFLILVFEGPAEVLPRFYPDFERFALNLGPVGG